MLEKKVSCSALSLKDISDASVCMIFLIENYTVQLLQKCYLQQKTQQVFFFASALSFNLTDSFFVITVKTVTSWGWYFSLIPLAEMLSLFFSLLKPHFTSWNQRIVFRKCSKSVTIWRHNTFRGKEKKSEVRKRQQQQQQRTIFQMLVWSYVGRQKACSIKAIELASSVSCWKPQWYYF